MVHVWNCCKLLLLLDQGSLYSSLPTANQKLTGKQQDSLKLESSTSVDNSAQPNSKPEFILFMDTNISHSNLSKYK